MMSKKLIGYVRVSSEVSKNKGNSIINQINKVNEFCKYNEFQLIDILKDEGKSGMEFSKRDGYLELIERCKSEDIDGVVVYCLSRIGRRMKDVVDIMELFSKNDIQFYSVKENINNSDMMGKLLMNILMSFNEFEVENIRERIKDVKRNNKENGLVYGKLMYGKDKDGKKLINDKDEMKVVSYIKSLRSKGWSYLRISERLNDKGIVSKSGKKWYGMSVSNVLSYYSI
ncbi:MAG: recombinase family protein [Pelagibacterales bacterium]|jgi:site-specific DNA recombinase|nr:recombinase family protein [Pelagibacterales bacterium]